ncbi:MAG TPA: hypothetical protein VIS09_12270, partial [Streptomyces sp.]
MDPVEDAPLRAPPPGGRGSGPNSAWPTRRSSGFRTVIGRGAGNVSAVAAGVGGTGSGKATTVGVVDRTGRGTVPAGPFGT